MEVIVFIVVTLFLILSVTIYILKRESRLSLSKIGLFTTKQSEEKETNKTKILSLLSDKGELSNEDIRKTINVSSRTVVNYMDELEKEGKVSQAGITGRFTVYRIK